MAAQPENIDVVKTGPIEPHVRAVTAGDVRAALAAGWADFKAAPAYGLFFGAVYSLGGLGMAYLLWERGHVWMIYPLAAGFALIAPFVAVGLYEVSRRRERGLPLSFAAVLGAAWEQGGKQLSWMAFVLLFVFIIWMYQVRLLFALFFGFAPVDADRFLIELVTTRDGLTFLAIGTAVGAVLAFLVFAITLVSFPLLLDRDLDWVTAMITSIRAVRNSPKVLLGHAFLTAIALFAAMAPAFLGLLIVLPLWGHATWHLYRRIAT